MNSVPYPNPWLSKNPATIAKIAPPMPPPNPTSPATDPTADRGKMSAGSVMINPDQDCWQKNAMLNSIKAHPTGTCGTSITTGIISALRPSTNFLEKSSDRPLLRSVLDSHPPRKLPTPDAAYGIQA